MKTEVTTFRHVEEYLFLKIAGFANDEISQHRIREAATPAQCKAIGRNIKVDKKRWFPEENKVMQRALYAKFSQNEELKDFLLSTGEKTLLEASPSDRYWGIGVSLGKVASSTPLNYTGKNKLGELLMNLRTQLSS